jgi:predicted nucleotidyltransferase
MMEIAELLRGFPRIRLAALFGSMARGVATEASDIDIGVSIHGEYGLLDLGEICSSLEAGLSRRIDLVDLDSALSESPLLAYEIASSGLPLVEREQGAWLRFKDRACLAYFDAKDFLDRQRELLYKRLSAFPSLGAIDA